MTNFTVGMVIPFSGPGAIYAPAAEAVTELAVSEINASNGILGREVSVEYIDSGKPLSSVRARVAELISAGTIHAIGGWHTSAVRNALAPVVAHRVPYVYPALYEGGEVRAGMYCTGETPGQQVMPAVRWLRRNLGVRRWFVVGDDYVWPRATHACLRDSRNDLGISLVDAQFLSTSAGREGHERYEVNLVRVIRRIEKLSPDGVLVLMVGQNAADFNRAFAHAGLHERIIRLSPLMEENTLMASGAEGSLNLYSSAAYFRTLATADAIELTSRYVHSNGVQAPALSATSESCYEGLFALSSIVNRASSSSSWDTDRVVDGAIYNGPRGYLRFEGNHVPQPVYLGRAVGYDFDVIDLLSTR